MSSLATHAKQPTPPIFFASVKTQTYPICLCGTPLAAMETQWLCAHCGRAFCRECGGGVMRTGGCNICTVCGAGCCE